MSTVYDVTDGPGRAEGLHHATDAIRRGELVAVPTDTVYGLAADAFSPDAVAALLAAKGRGRSMPPPVLVGAPATLDGIADAVPQAARDLVERFWPGPLTLVLLAQPSLTWDLGETHGTVAVRMPADDVAVELLTITGPLAVSSANLSGRTAAATAAEARAQLGDSVSCYLDDGREAAATPVASTIVDATRPRLRVLRQGSLSLAELREVVPDLLGVDEQPEPDADAAAADAAADVDDADDQDVPDDPDDPDDDGDDLADPHDDDDPDDGTRGSG